MKNINKIKLKSCETVVTNKTTIRQIKKNSLSKNKIILTFPDIALAVVVADDFVGRGTNGARNSQKPG